jgi:hypothetical protein
MVAGMVMEMGMMTVMVMVTVMMVGWVGKAEGGDG